MDSAAILKQARKSLDEQYPTTDGAYTDDGVNPVPLSKVKEVSLQGTISVLKAAGLAK